MSPPDSPFVPRVFSKPTEEELAQLTRPSFITNEDYDVRRSAIGFVFTAPTTKPIYPAPSSSHSTCLGTEVSDERPGDHSGAGQGVGEIVANQDVLVVQTSSNDDLHGTITDTQALDHQLGSSLQNEEAKVDNDELSLVIPESSNIRNGPSAEYDSDLEWDQPGAFNFLANIDIDNLEISDNDTRSSGFTEFSPLRPRRLYETALLNRAAQGCSSLRESALWSDGEDTADLSSIADANDLSQYHADLEDELDGNDTNTDEDDSEYEYSSACSTLAASDESDDDDFFDARSDSEHSEESVF